MIVATTGVVPVFTAVKLAILPVPVAARPIVVLLLVQLYTVPVTAPAKVTAAVAAPLHTVWFAGCVTVGVGFTVIVNVIGVPGQPFATGVTVIVATTGTIPALVAVKLAILPVPEAARPILGVLFVQLYTVPATEFVVLNTTAFVAEPLHTTWLDTGLMIGVGLTVIVKVIGVPLQVTPALV